MLYEHPKGRTSEMTSYKTRELKMLLAMLYYAVFSLFWFDIKYSLIKAKLQLQNNNPNLCIKNKNDLTYLCYYSYKFFI